ncbi:MAG: hypothetical protein QGH34_01750 [Candidatus Woesearchaeota archaeon]|jgi:hypothetical protein|nr:hypothetical protein [Candidatus Woesearchaeota archaeon]|tara:strand:+ start:2996 stop:3640 length:645 start_codon:yes stop_codon:yes gene_type:complete
MSQIEQLFREFLNKNPEVENCYQQGLINRRSLARYLIKNEIAKSNQLEATIAMLRRFKFKKINNEEKNVFKDIKINIKDNITILDFEKEKELVKKLESIIAKTNYDKGDTLKIVIGSSSIKLFIDKENQKIIKNLIEKFNTENTLDSISEISVMFPKNAIDTKGILSTITKELVMNEIIISEFLTASPELLIYVKDEYVLKTYEILKRIKKSIK